MFAMREDEELERKHTKSSTIIVGINPDLWNVAGRLSIAGPVKEFTAIEMPPNIPIVPSTKLKRWISKWQRNTNK